tara:strand:+ start:263 stop:1519 length:1257 start_codon:yes stop_codon:yes gene_type:complete
MSDKNFSKSKTIKAAIDIGSSKIACAVGRGIGKFDLEILGYAYYGTNNVKKGLIIEPIKIEKEINKLIGEIENKTQTEISNVIVNASTTKSKSKFLEGSVNIGGEKIDNLHIKSAINNSNFNSDNEDYEPLHEMIKFFNIDNEKKVKDPIDLYGDILSVEIYQLLIKKNYIKSLKNILTKSNLNIDSIIATSFASSLSTLTKDEKDLGTICIDLGAGTTSICLMENDNLIFADAIPIGSNNITFDLSAGLNTSVESAERLKTLYGSVFTNPSDEYEIIDVPIIGSDKSQFNQVSRSIVNSYIKPRVEETLELIRQKLKEYNLHHKRYRRVVLTGGGSLLEGIEDYAKIIFDSQIRIASPYKLKGMSKDIERPQFSSVIGMLLASNNESKIQNYFGEKTLKKSRNTLFSRFSDWLDLYI